MKNSIAFLLCIILLLTLFACSRTNTDPDTPSDSDTENTTAPTEEETTTESQEEESSTPPVEEESAPSVSNEIENQRALEAFGAVMRNEITMYYPAYQSTWNEIYFQQIGLAQTTPSYQALIDMDQDGIKELILSYDEARILLHFENDLVYGFDKGINSMITIYTDGSFSWSYYSDKFGSEYGISRISFDNGKPKYHELSRVENYTKFYLNGVQVTEEQYNTHIENRVKTSIEFEPFDLSLLDPNRAWAIELASEHWGIKDGDFHPETGYRYRVVCTENNGDIYRVSLYCFVRNYYYEHVELALVNIKTEEITIYLYPDGK